MIIFINPFLQLFICSSIVCLYFQIKPCDDHTYAQVKEITGITDRKVIDQAVNCCRNNDGKYDVSDVVGYLIGDEKRRPAKRVSFSRIFIFFI